MLPRMGTPGGEGISGMMDTGKGITIIQGAQGMGWEEEEKNPKPTTEVLQEMGHLAGGTSAFTNLQLAWVLPIDRSRCCAPLGARGALGRVESPSFTTGDEISTIEM